MMRIRDTNAWLTKKEIKSFIDAWAKCCTHTDLSKFQRSSLMYFRKWAIRLPDSLVKSYVYLNLVKVCEQLGVPSPEYKMNDAFYRYWQEGEERKRERWCSHIRHCEERAMEENGIDEGTLELKLTAPGDRMSDIENLVLALHEKVEALEAEVARLKS